METQPKNGDRIIIKNIPEDYHYRDLYDLQFNGNGQGTIQDHFDIIQDDGVVPFYTGYTPYKDNGRMDVSGCGRAVNLSDLTLIEQAPAPFWRFKNGVRKAHNGETYFEVVSWFDCDFKQLL